MKLLNLVKTDAPDTVDYTTSITYHGKHRLSKHIHFAEGERLIKETIRGAVSREIHEEVIKELSDIIRKGVKEISRYGAGSKELMDLIQEVGNLRKKLERGDYFAFKE